MTRREKERKIKMFGMIGMSLLVIASLATATYAWFTKIVATVNTGTMTVVAPDEYSFYAYKGNRDSSHTLQNSFADDFTRVESSNLAAETSLSGLNPGDIKTYCIVVTGHDVSKNVTLHITRITSNDANMEHAGKHRYVFGTSVEINIGWAINIYSTYATSNVNTGYASFVSSTSGTDKFNYNNDNRSTLLAGTSAGGNAIDLSTPIPIFDSAVANETVYLYYSIVFMDDNSVLYKEVDSSGNSLIMPSSDSTRRFKLYNEKDTAIEKSRCNSNCYEGLTFALNSLSLTF